MPFRNPDADAIAALLRRIRSVAVVGLSPDPAQPSHGVARALQGFGYRVVPVRPGVDSILGEKAWPDLDSLPEPVDCVNVFRRSSELGAVVDAAVRIGASVVWAQEGVFDEAAAERARNAGLTVVMDRCIYKAYLASRI